MISRSELYLGTTLKAPDVGLPCGTVRCPHSVLIGASKVGILGYWDIEILLPIQCFFKLIKI